MIGIHHAVEQMAWADDKLFEFLEQLPDEAWRAQSASDEWPVVALTFHLVASADWYRFILGGPILFTGEPDSIAEVRGLRATWKEIDAFLVNESLKEDELLTFREHDEDEQVLRSTALTQAVIHAVEHRTQIAIALKSGGFALPDLEDFSAWAYMTQKG